jgi:hypothetical protein
VKMIDLACIKCGVPLRRTQSAENYRIKHGRAGPYCSRTCTSRLDDPRLFEEPPPVSGAKWIRLTRGKFALVDEDMFSDLNQRAWHWVATGESAGYAVSGSRESYVQLHRLILGVTDPKVCVDHKDNNGLDCRRKNLRIASRLDNGANRDKFVGRPGRKFTSRYKGVVDRSKHYTQTFVRNITKKASDYPWLARIRVDHKLIHIGRFATELEAARAYDVAAIRHFGEFAKINFPLEARSA